MKKLEAVETGSWLVLTHLIFDLVFCTESKIRWDFMKYITI